jgi:hypothetical protein
MSSWIRNEASESTNSEVSYNDYSQAVVQAYASNLKHLSASQIRIILEQTSSIKVVEAGE